MRGDALSWPLRPIELRRPVALGSLIPSRSTGSGRASGCQPGRSPRPQLHIWWTLLPRRSSPDRALGWAGLRKKPRRASAVHQNESGRSEDGNAREERKGSNPEQASPRDGEQEEQPESISPHRYGG